jgi:hypothetical protein
MRNDRNILSMHISFSFSFILREIEHNMQEERGGFYKNVVVIEKQRQDDKGMVSPAARR